MDNLALIRPLRRAHLGMSQHASFIKGARNSGKLFRDISPKHSILGIKSNLFTKAVTVA